MNILVIDIGTSSMRGILYSGNGERLCKHQILYNPIHSGDNCVEQGSDDFENALVAIIKNISQHQSTIDAITLTSQRSSVVPVDDKGVPLSDFIMWQDTRNQKICKSLEKYNDLVYARSGSKVNCVFSGGKMSWIKEAQPELYKQTHKIVNIPEYLMQRMTGEYVTDYTYGSRSNLMNLHTCQWDDDLLRIFGIDKDLLCELKMPGSVCGRINAEFARQTGVIQGIPVISAGGDQQCASVGYGAYKEGVVSIVTGTGAYLTTIIDDMPINLSNDIICNYSAVEGKYILEGNVLTCCSAFDWYCRNFFDWDSPDYEWLEKQLSEKYGKKMNCLVLPYFRGRSTPAWNADARATFHDINLSTDRIDILKAILEGIFIEIDNNIGCFRDYVEVNIAGVSGGLTNNRILNQIQADIYGMPLVHMLDTETTANGAFMIAAKTIGICKSLDEAYEKICRWTELEKYEPDSSHHQNYQEIKTKMNMLYQKIYM